MEPILRRALALYNHPLLLELRAEQSVNGPEGQLQVAMQMVVARLGAPLLMELVKLLEDTKQKTSSPGE